jgi:hypothetical protein
MESKRDHRFADPWAFRRRRSIEPVAGLDGRSVDACVYRRGGELIQRAHIEHAPATESQHAEPSRLNELRRRRAKELAIHRLSGEFSDDDMSLIEAVLEGRSLSDWARSQANRVSRQAAWDRLQRIKQRAPFVWLAWVRSRSQR